MWCLVLLLPMTKSLQSFSHHLTPPDVRAQTSSPYLALLDAKCSFILIITKRITVKLDLLLLSCFLFVCF
ncbi:hypothetical protein FKM82_000559 [Ascaphus truei]